MEVSTFNYRNWPLWTARIKAVFPSLSVASKNFEWSTVTALPMTAPLILAEMIKRNYKPDFPLDFNKSFRISALAPIAAQWSAVRPMPSSRVRHGIHTKIRAPFPWCILWSLSFIHNLTSCSFPDLTLPMRRVAATSDETWDALWMNVPGLMLYKEPILRDREDLYDLNTLDQFFVHCFPTRFR